MPLVVCGGLRKTQLTKVNGAVSILLGDSKPSSSVAWSLLPLRDLGEIDIRVADAFTCGYKAT